MWRNGERTREEVMPAFATSKSVIVFDTETTGLGSSAKIIQFSGIRYLIGSGYELTEDGKIDIYINPKEPLSEKIIEITGITDEILRHANPEEKEVYRIGAFLKSADMISAYNSPFDLRMLDQMSERTGYKFPHIQCVDVLKLARDMISLDEVENHKLETVIGYLFPERNYQFHSALEDVTATAEILKYYLQNNPKNSMNEKTCVKLEWASFSINPRKESQIRIKLKLPVGEYGDIFWDVVKSSWGHKSTAKAKKLFESINLQNLEQQVLNRYGWKYHATDMDTLGKEWGKAKRKQSK